ncbi:CLUMA_CG009703, isoform A [Clunio marinus]|uniref:CLUMA_CG009703, isoform A n=1 Tax=Clunio marinus TaxID=568069 RepID=A0A1J1ICW3_9DIPT|nr:CLUMA_CG009703, isoform A [Clunio marinus]
MKCTFKMSESSTQSESDPNSHNKSSNEVDENRSTLSFFLKIGYGFGHVYNDLSATIWFSYILLYLKDVLEMPNEAGYLMMLGQIADAVFSAIVGLMTDRYYTKRNWHMMGTLIVILSFPFLFMLEQNVLPYLAKIFYFILFITLFQCGWATVQISHLAILPELSITHKDRSDLNSVRYCMSIFSNITVFTIAWTVLHIRNRNSESIGPNDFDKFRNITIFLTAIGILTTIIFEGSLSLSKYNKRREDKFATSELDDSTSKSSSVEIINVLKDLQLYKIAFLYTFSRLFLVICIIYIPIWLNDFMKTRTDQTIENIAIIPLIFFVASFVAAFLLKYLNQKLSHKIVYCAGSLISISGCVWIFFSISLGANELIGIAILLGAGSSTTQISSLCITADLIGDKAEHGGLIYSIITVCDKLFSGIIIFVIENLEAHQNYYSNVLIFNAITAFVGILILGTFIGKH